MKNIFCTIALLLSFGHATAQTGSSTAQAANAATQENINLLVGTYTDGGSCGIYSFRLNQLTGKATVLDSLKVKNPSFLTLSADRRHIYSVGETEDAQASLHVIGFDGGTGKMRMIGAEPTKGKSPCYVSTHGDFALTANYSGGSMSVFRLQEEGSQARLCQQFTGTMGGPDAVRQEAPHVHCAVFCPDGKYILATDFSADRILSYRLKKKVKGNGVAARIEASSGPRHLVFSNDGRFCYLISELSGKVTVFSYKRGRLKELQTVVSDSVGARGSADIHISPDGRFLYASNRLKADGIAIFSIDGKTGLLRPVGYQPTGAHPRHFNITPNGRYLLCACRDSNIIQVFRRDMETGLLTDTQQDLHVSKAVCVQF